MFEVIRGPDALYYPAARQRSWGGMWEGVVRIVRGTKTSLHVCAECHDDVDAALMDAVTDALVMAAGKEV
ncbi:hypothetical protein [Pseudacidovorax intermedius]|uniref:hypothetical protein n=1 Tax=Pseudacidovorax intermedius TaxID=433924 RepID=UPI0026F05F71|nr:hypothetical protein [Pseudacidovorax intermedius]